MKWENSTECCWADLWLYDNSLDIYYSSFIVRYIFTILFYIYLLFYIPIILFLYLLLNIIFTITFYSSNVFFLCWCFLLETTAIYHSPTDNVSNSAIIGFDTTPGPDVSVMRNCTWSHSLLVFTICMSTSVPCSFFATVYFRNKSKFFLSFFPSYHSR